MQERGMHNPSTVTERAQPQTFKYFDDRTALALSQAFGQEQTLEPLLALMQAQLGALCGAVGLTYVYTPANVDMRLGEQTQHDNEFKLTFGDVALGVLTLHYPGPCPAEVTATAEDVVALAFTAIRNAVTQLQLRELHRDGADKLSQAERTALSQSSHGARSTKTDTLILVALDNLTQIEKDDGAEWAQVVMSSTHEQIQEGLRQADGVYHVGEDLIAILLPNTSEQQALDVAKKIRRLIASLHLRGNAIDMQLTASMGVANAQHENTTASKTTLTAEDIMSRARRALAQAQREGPNQICVCQAAAGEAVEEGGVTADEVA